MRRKIKYKNVFILLFVLGILLFSLGLILKNDEQKLSDNNQFEEKKQEVITDFKNMKLSEVEEYVKDNNLKLDIVYQFSEIDKDIVIENELNDNNLKIVVS